MNSLRGKLMRILVINTVPFMKNGISQMIVNYAINMPKSMKWDVFANEVISEDYRENFKRSDLRVIVAPSRKKHPLGYLRLLASTIKSSKYDAIYIHCNSSMVALDLRFIRLFFHKLIFVHVHGVTTNYPKMEKALRGLMPKSKIVNFAASKQAGNWLFHDKKFLVIPNAINYRQYSFSLSARKKVRKKLHIGDRQLLVLQVGLFNEQKNQIFSIKLLEKLKDKDNFHFLFVGDGPKKAEVMSSVNKKNLGRYATFLPASGDMQEIYSGADVMLFPSIFEPFGMVSIEAQANGLHVLQSENVPDITSIVRGLTTTISLNRPGDWLDAINRSVIRSGNDVDEDLIGRDFSHSSYDVHSAAKSLVDIMDREVKSH